MAVGAQTQGGVATGPHIPPRLIPDAGGEVNILGTLTDVATADGAGVATVKFVPPADAGTHVELELVVVVSDSAAASAARVYVGKVNAAGLRDIASVGNENVLYEQPAVYAGAQQDILVQWTGCTAGATCTATIQYRIKS